MNALIPTVGPALLVLTLLACAGKQDASTAAGDSEIKDPVKTQIADGARLYGAQCASCHGDAGEGGSAPALVGAGALPGDPPAERQHRTMRFRTIADVRAFVTEAMPPGDPSAIDAEGAWAILAFDLSANGIELKAPLTATSASAIAIPAGGL